MDYVQIITNEWIDIIYLDNKTNKAIRKNLNFGGSYYFENNQDILYIIWDIWGKETFFKKGDIYYNISSNIFEIELENNKDTNDENYAKDTNDTKNAKIYIFNYDDNSVYLKNKESSEENIIGFYKFSDNILTVIWNNKPNKKYEQIDVEKSKKYEQIDVEKSKKYEQIDVEKSKKYRKIEIKKNTKKDIKILVIVFPQFHEIPENNEFWGHGFTEWTLLKNIPRIVNGEIIKQPHEDIGYFNLNDINHRSYMTTLANRFNIYGFCYYHYWFKNKKVMYEPLEKMLIDGHPNKPFLFCWANEQWTRRWDGGNEEVLLEQSYSDNEGNINHFLYLLEFFKHHNYIKVMNKPIFIFYRIEEKDIEQINTIIKLWNNMALENGFDGIYFMRFLGPFNNNIVINDIKGYVEFEPGYCTQKNYNEICVEDNNQNKIFDQYNGQYNEETYLMKNSDIKSLVEKKIYNSGLEHYNSISEKERTIRTSQFFTYDGLKLYEKILELPRIYKEQHRGLSLQWNNTPRRNYTNKEYNKYPHYYKNINPQLFGNTLKQLMDKINSDSNEIGHDFLFLSAWNEWNEQAILEPNNEDGYDYLHNLKKNYLEFYEAYPTKNILVFGHKGGGTEKYMDDIKNKFLEYKFIDFDTYNEEINYDIYYNGNNQYIDRIHINSILYNNLKTNYVAFFTKYFKNIEKYLTIHDYQWYYPDNPNILKDDFNNDLPPTITNINNFYKLIKLCTKIIFPSQSIYKNYSKYINLSYYNDKICVVNHMDKIINHNFLVCPPILNNNNKIKIAFIGNFLKYKGTDVLNYLSNNFQIYRKYKEYFSGFSEGCMSDEGTYYSEFDKILYNIEYHIYGLVIDKNIIKKNKYKYIFHDIYKDNEIIDLIHQEGIHGILHLSIFEETYCYSLTNSINSGLPIFYLNYGAFPERLNKYNFKNKYFASDKNDIFENYIKFLDFIVNHQGEKQEFYKLNQNIQYNKWYLENY